MIKQKIEFERIEKEPTTKLIGSSQAPEEYKKNPFFNSYSWAKADWIEGTLFLPDNSDEAISFSVASHELGHLVKKNRIEGNSGNFQDAYQEELRAWEVGWSYLEKYLANYYDNQALIDSLKIVKEKVEEKIMNITLLSEPYYKKIEKNDIHEQRKSFLQSEEGKTIKAQIDGLQEFVKEILINLNQESFLNKTDWNKFSRVIKKALFDIEADNRTIR